MNSIVDNRFDEPMRPCADLTVTRLNGAHWLPLERKAGLADAMGAWIEAKKLRGRDIRLPRLEPHASPAQ